jgi:hypothetical protein
MIGDERYEPVNNAWPAIVPPCTRHEAERAMKALCRKFGGTIHGSPAMNGPVRSLRVRSCWITRKPSTLYRGWQRLAHDISHSIFRRRHPSFKPHDGGHATLEREIAEHILAAGWLSGSLRPVAAPKPTTDDKLSKLDARIARWETKAKRAETALRKLRRSRSAMLRRRESVTRVTDSPEARA